jgi:hypothetical protein
MRRALQDALKARECDGEAREAMRPALILFPGQEPPEGWDGDVCRLQVVDGRKTTADKEN